MLTGANSDEIYQGHRYYYRNLKDGEIFYIRTYGNFYLRRWH